MNQSVEVPEITATELKARLDADDVPVLVDVREEFEKSIADLPPAGQLNMPTGVFPQRMAELDPGADLVLYCRSGSRSEWAARLLIDAGYERVFNLRGGVLAWREDVDPTLQAY